MSSISRAPAKSSASPRGFATICRPTGRPWLSKPQGMEIAGAPSSVIAYTIASQPT